MKKRGNNRRFFLSSKRGSTFLTENIVFIVLNLIFLTILILFVFSKTGNAAILEEKYAKQIAMIIDSAKPVMEIYLNMEDAIKKAGKEKFEGNLVIIEGNIVTVKLREGKGYSYSFFNDVEVNAYPDSNEEGYIFVVSGYRK